MEWWGSPTKTTDTGDVYGRSDGVVSRKTLFSN